MNTCIIGWGAPFIISYNISIAVWNKLSQGESTLRPFRSLVFFFVFVLRKSDEAAASSSASMVVTALTDVDMEVEYESSEEVSDNRDVNSDYIAQNQRIENRVNLDWNL